MSENGWKPTAIHELIAESVPGEWGTEGSQETGVPVLRSTNFVDDGTIDYSDIAYRKVPVARLEKRRITTGTLLMEKAGGSSTRPAGRVVFCDRDFNGTASNFVEIIKVRDDHSPKYVFYLLYRNFHTGLVYKYQQQTTGIINFKIREYSEEIVDVPADKTEQSKIAEILSTVDRAIEQTESLIAKQQRIKTGLMQDLLTRGIDEQGNLRSEETHQFKDSPLGRIPVEWDVEELSSVLLQIKRGPSLSTNNERRGIIYLTSDNISEAGELVWDSIKHLDVRASTLKSILKINDVILNCVNSEAQIGKLGFVDSLIGVTTTGFNNFGLTFDEELYAPKFAFYFLSHDNFQRELRKKIKPAINQSSFSSTDILDLPVIVPPKNEQLTVAERLDAVSSSQRKLGTTLSKLKHIKTALMQDLLTGEKRVTPLLEPAVTT